MFMATRPQETALRRSDMSPSGTGFDLDALDRKTLRPSGLLSDR